MLREKSGPSSPGTAPIGESADVWSLGMVLHEILSGEVPFDSEAYRALSLDAFLVQLREGARPEMPKEVAHISWLSDLVRLFYLYFLNLNVDLFVLYIQPYT